MQQWATQYAYDANSNRCADRTLTTTAPSTLNCSSSSDSVTNTYAVNAADELTTENGSTVNTFDANGNIVNGSQWAYNTQDQAKSYTPPLHSTINMTYRGGGQFDRAAAGSTTFTSDALGLGQEVTGSTTTKYTRAPSGTVLGFNRGGTRYYYALDGQGSVAAAIKDDGTTAATYDYDPFGQLRSSTGSVSNPFRWLGSLGVYADDATTALYKMGTRWYDPAIGRFTQVDPVKGGALNAYDYAGQDPINVFDPDGTKPICDPDPHAIPGYSAPCRIRYIDSLVLRCAYQHNRFGRKACHELKTVFNSPVPGFLETVCNIHSAGAATAVLFFPKLAARLSPEVTVVCGAYSLYSIFKGFG